MKTVNLMISLLLLSIMASATFSAAKAEFVITQQDEDDMIKFAEELREWAHSKYEPDLSSSVAHFIPFDELQKCDAYNKLIEYDWKLVPYQIRKIQIENELRVIIGSALANRAIESLEDLYNYQGEKLPGLSEEIAMRFPGRLLYQTTVGKEVCQKLGRKPDRAGFSWIEWWGENKDRFKFKTKKRFKIGTQYKYFNHPHVSTVQHGGLLHLEAVNATYRQIIERAAAELGVNVFIGEQIDIDVICTVRMRSVTFEEFAYLIGRTVHVGGFKYYKDGNKYHFGSEVEAKPREILDGWGIMMNRTVFYEGDTIPVTVITRGTGELVDPLDRVFYDYGSFKITTNNGTIIRDYNIQRKTKPTLELINREKDCTKIDLNLSNYCQLPPGEYNVRLKYLSHETPSIAIEIYRRK